MTELVIKTLIDVALTVIVFVALANEDKLIAFEDKIIGVFKK